MNVRPLTLLLEPSDEAWQNVHDALREFDPKRYDECETDDLLQRLFEIIGNETKRCYRAGQRSKKRKLR